jgi:hypothetical protein
MMGSRDRLIVTALIWVMFAVVVGSFLSVPAGPALRMSDEFILGIVAVLSLAAVIPTTVMWRNGGGAQAAPSPADTARQSHKAKRDQAARIQSLMERLDEDEIVELETLLQSREDEAHWRR